MELKKIVQDTLKNKKRMLLIATATKIPILIYLLVLVATVPGIDAVEYDYIKGAHRGNSVEAIENTIESIQMALDDPQYIFIEFDIQYTKDKQLVVFHEKRPIGIECKIKYDKVDIEELTYAQVLECSTYKIPLYNEIIELIGDKKKINIEIKSQGNLEDDKEIVDFIIKDAQERGILQNIMLSSLSSDVVKYIDENYPEIKTGKIYLVKPATYLHFDYFTESLYQEVEECGGDYILLHGQNIHNISRLIDLKPKDKTLIFWYFTDEIYLVQKDSTDVLW